jgi:hypothetical protein
MEDFGKGKMGTEHRVVSCGKGSCGKGWIDCQAVTTKRHGPPKVQPPKPTPIHGPSPYRHNSLTKTPPFPESSASCSDPLPLLTALTPRRFRRPRFLLCRNLSPPLIPQSPLSRPYNPNSGEPRIPPNHPSIWILR